ncbi:MAG: mandelate racemase/muconate lactonizing enzyme family protein [Bryobacterales bacterium]|nr:mandelate racemase/muconate lactonizing enzyme family protein [Bryobacterales bacterium]
MKITAIEAFPVRMPRDMDAATGTAGSPTQLAAGAGGSGYRWSTVFPCLYSMNFETALVKVSTEGGLTGWGEAQAPLAPEVACEIVRLLLAPLWVGMEFSGDADTIADWWQAMYQTMRVRGQTGGFMLDAVSGVDMALWDLAGKMAGKPVSAMLTEAPKRKVKAYLSGLPAEGRKAAAARHWVEGFREFKLFFDTQREDEFFRGLGDLPAGARFAADALWRLEPETAVEFGKRCDDEGALWLEAPLAPETPLAHGALARAIQTPIGLGESYRTRYEMAPFFREKAVGVYQPDLGRCGITEGMRLAAMAAGAGATVVPHVSIAMGPQIAAALHFAAAVDACLMAEYNPKVFSVANRFLKTPLRMEGNRYVVPEGPGLGIEMDEDALARVAP